MSKSMERKDINGCISSSLWQKLILTPIFREAAFVIWEMISILSQARIYRRHKVTFNMTYLKIKNTDVDIVIFITDKNGANVGQCHITHYLPSLYRWFPEWMRQNGPTHELNGCICLHHIWTMNLVWFPMAPGSFSILRSMLYNVNGVIWHQLIQALYNSYPMYLFYSYTHRKSSVSTPRKACVTSLSSCYMTPQKKFIVGVVMGSFNFDINTK